MSGHVLDLAISRATRHADSALFESYSGENDRNLGLLASSAGLAAYTRTHHRRELHLTEAAALCIEWLNDLNAPAGGPLAAIRDEFDRAHAKHRGLTPLSPLMCDHDRSAILIEEVGEVARALTPDAHTEVGHAGDLVEELVQTATMACAWLAHCLAKTGGA